MLRLEDCSASWPVKGGWHKVFSNLSFACQPGETLMVLGPSGCGKTTLLNICAGVKQPSSGNVLLDEQMLVKGNKKIAYVFQHFGLFPWFNALENVALGLHFRGMPALERRELAMGELVRVGLDGLENRYPHQLSGGQQQRVALARSLILQPELLLLDEPFSALDSLTREKLQELLAELLAERSLMTIMVTHSLEEAAFLGSQILLMSPGPDSRLTVIPGLAANLPRDSRLRKQAEYYACCAAIRTVLDGGQI